MKVVFRVDSGIDIGVGHVMRCLTLADALRAQGATCCFICRAHPGNISQLINDRGFKVTVLPLVSPPNFVNANLASGSPYAAWLGAEWECDAQQTISNMGSPRPDWLIVDHYALSEPWERMISPHCNRVLVIDDLADRPHSCDLLLDQTFGFAADRYAGLVPKECTVLAGAQYSLLRPEFGNFREFSLRRRKDAKLNSLLVSLGGIDRDNMTAEILLSLRDCPLSEPITINVVMGATAPWLNEVKKCAARMPWRTNVHLNVSEMARLMAESDLAIGAAGTTSWERCCLGLPTILITVAENQKDIAETLGRVGAALVLDIRNNQMPNLAHAITTCSNPIWLSAASAAASAVTSGCGTILVSSHLVLGR